jgi:AcrR family transcriptional regulator
VTTRARERYHAALSRERVLAAAVALADREGLPALTMRRLAAELGVEAMSLYHHVPNKEALLDGLVEVVVEEINTAVRVHDRPEPTRDWKADLRESILTARQVLLRHPWAPALIETRSSLSLPVVVYHEHVLRLMREGGFSYDLAHHALHALGSRALGFTQELFRPDDAAGEEEVPDLPVEQFPHLAGMLAEAPHTDSDVSLGWCDDQSEFEFALDLLLDGLERLRQREAGS